MTLAPLALQVPQGNCRKESVVVSVSSAIVLCRPRTFPANRRLQQQTYVHHDGGPDEKHDRRAVLAGLCVQ